MKNKLFIISLLLTIVFGGCKDDDFIVPRRPIYFINNYVETEFVVVLPYCSYPNDIVYDSLIRTLEHTMPAYYFLQQLECKCILANEYPVRWHCDTLTAYILCEEELRSHKWDNIIKDSLWQCKYELSLQEIRVLHDTIPYPPSPAMKDMKMYPSYEEITNKEEHP